MHIKEEGQARRKFIDLEPAFKSCFDIGQTIGKRKGQLLHSRSPSLAYMVAANTDRVPQRHLPSAELDHVSHEALIARHDGRIVGIAEWGRWQPGDDKADIAVVVRDDCRRHGIARALIRRLARNARAHSIETFAGTILSTNRASIALLQDVAPVKTVALSGATFDVTIPLTATA